MSTRITGLELLRPDFADRVARLIAKIRAEGIPLAVFETVRPPARQIELYARGRDATKADFGRTVTKAKAYQSAHQYGLAVDFVFRDATGEWSWDEPEPLMWRRYTQLARSVGLETLSFERPHVQIDPFPLHAMQPGPMDTTAWLEWLRDANGAGAIPEVET